MVLNSEGKAVDGVIGQTLVEGLIGVGCPERSANIFCKVKGLMGESPKSLRTAWPGISGERVRQIVIGVESRCIPMLMLTDCWKDLTAATRALVAEIAKEAPNSSEVIQDALTARGVLIGSPSGVLRMAVLLEIDTELRTEVWTGLSKYHNSNRPGAGKVTGEGRITRVDAIVPMSMPNVLTNFISLARRVSRGMGVMSAGKVAELYSLNRGIPVSAQDAKAMLSPFAIHLGRIEGDDWYTFLSSTNEFVSKAESRVKSLGKVSFEMLCDYHRRFNRSEYVNGTVPREALRSALAGAGFEINEDVVTIIGKVNVKTVRSLTPIQEKMISVFRSMELEAGSKGTVQRLAFSRALVSAGINETTAHIYLSNRGLFTCVNGLCRLNDKMQEVEIPVSPVHVHLTGAQQHAT